MNSLDDAQFVALASLALDERADGAVVSDGETDAVALEDVLSVATSACGARAQAVLA